jgi:DNA-binding transcriptional LysR family regulator
VPRPRDDPTLERHPVCEDPLVVALAPTHPLAVGDGSPVALRELASARWATPREDTAYAGMVAGACRALGGFDPRVVHRVNDLQTLLALAAIRAAATDGQPISVDVETR